MNAVEIEVAVSDLTGREFDQAEFAFEFLRAFGNKETTLQRLRSGVSNKSDVGGVLQRNNIHILVAPLGDVGAALYALRSSPATTKAKARFILATDGVELEAENLETGETVACAYSAFPDHFSFFLDLAGITTVKAIRESAFDIRATSRLNRLYVELLKDNPEWGSAERRHDMNHFMARLIFCFFAEDTDIFSGQGLFTDTVSTMSDRSSANTHEVISAIFRAMNTKHEERAEASVPRWALPFPYVNGGLFSGSVDVPVFSRIARSYLIHIGGLEWTRINPDIFGSMIQAVADDEERGALGMHYTSVPNILKVLNPLFLDDLRGKLAEAGSNARMLLNLRKRIARIRVFDPACGSGNFLVIAYKQLREIEHAINERRGEQGRASDIPLTNFRGIEIRDFAAEIARLALIIAEFQSDVLYRGQQDALKEFLPLDSQNWITCGNALRIDWLSVCPPTGTGVKVLGDDLFSTPLDQAEIDFENEGGDTYICGNPPYLGSKWQTQDQKAELQSLFGTRTRSWKLLDYVAGWLIKAADYGQHTSAVAGFVATNSICQGQQVPILWPLIFATGHEIAFAHASFQWNNLASHNAGVTVVIVGITNHAGSERLLLSPTNDSGVLRKSVSNINPYLVAGRNVIVERALQPLSDLPEMVRGNMPYDGGNLLLSPAALAALCLTQEQQQRFVRKIYGSSEFIRGQERYCLWITSDTLDEALKVPPIRERIERVREMRLASSDEGAREMANRPHEMREMNAARHLALVLPRITSENRSYLPSGLVQAPSILSSQNFALYDEDILYISIIVSRVHWVWIRAVCTTMRTDFSYTNTLGWNTFPLPTLTAKNKEDLRRGAEDILLTREGHFPATIADLYDPDTMPDDLREAHERNDEVIERIYIGRRFRNDTERLEKLFDLYTKMTATQNRPAKRAAKARRA